MSALLTCAAAVASGLLLAHAFPPRELAALGWIALVPWLAALGTGVSPRVGAVSGVLHGAALHGVALSWMVKTMAGHGGLSPLVAWGSFAAALVVLSPWSLLAGWITATTCRAHGSWGLLALVLAEPVLEALRGRLALGLPWAVPALTQVSWLPALGVAEWGGAHAVSALVVLGNVALAALVLAVSRPRGRAASLAVAALAVVATGAALLHGSASAAAHATPANEGVVVRVPEDSPVLQRVRADNSVWVPAGVTPPWPDAGQRAAASDPVLRVAIVQAAVPQEVVLLPDADSDLERALLQVRLTQGALALGADLIVWSESSHPATAGTMPWLLPYLRQVLRESSQGPGRPPAAVVGVVIEASALTRRHVRKSGQEGDITNSVVLLDAHGARGRYDKVHLVPFGEHVPAPWLFAWFDRLVVAVGNFRAGTSTEPLAAEGARLGTFVCYEAVLADHVRRFVLAGADVLVNVTNDGWFHGSDAPSQHLAFSVLRAVETRRHVVRCANSGISAVVGPDGRIVARLGEGQRGLILAQVPTLQELTPWVRHGERPLLCVAFALCVWLLAALATPLAVEHDSP